MEGDKILLSRNISGLNIPYPHNLCFGSNRKVKVEILGLGAAGAQMTPSCDAIECTVVPEDLTTDEIENLLNQVCDNPDCKDAERQNIENAKGFVDLKLRVRSCFTDEGDKTIVEFIATPKPGVAAKEVKIFETIDKTKCSIDFKNSLTKVEGGDGDIIVNPDPMLVWPFTTLKEEQKVSYELSLILDDNCRKELKAAVGAEVIAKKDKPIEQIKVEDLNENFASRRGIDLSRDRGKLVVNLPQIKRHNQRFNPATAPPEFVKVPEDKKRKSLE